MKRYERWWSTAGLTAALALTGCGGPDDQPDASTGATSSPVDSLVPITAPPAEPLAPLPTDARSLAGFRAQVFALNLGLELNDASVACAGDALMAEFGSIEALEELPDALIGANADAAIVALTNCGATSLEEVETGVTTSPVEATTPAADVPPTSEVFTSLADAKAALIEALRTAQVGDDAALNCLFDTLGERLGDDELLRQITADESTAEELAGVRAAAVTCGVDPSFTDS